MSSHFFVQTVTRENLRPVSSVDYVLLYFQIPTKLKEALRIAKECIEKRLIEEQKQVNR